MINQLFKIPLSVCLMIPFVVAAQTKKTKAVVTTAVNKNLIQASIARGKTLYATYCLTCHQIDGSGVPSLNPPLIKTKWVLGDKSVLIRQVLNGSTGKVQIDGDTFHNAMPPLGAQLSDEQIADVLTYVRNSFGNKASAVNPSQVKMLRNKKAN